MSSIIVPYYTGSGHTKKLADYIVEGVENVKGVQATLIDITDFSPVHWRLLHEADGIIFGSPTYMGNISGLFKSFMDETGDFWQEQKWANKIAAGFTVGTSASGDKLNSLVQMAIFASQHGMIWVGQNHVGSKHTKDGMAINEAGSWLGLMAQSDKDKSILISEHDARTAAMFGERIANAVLRWNPK